jgi:hypothetical protein
VYIADSRNFRIRKVTVSTGIITTIAGTGASSYSGDNGAATSAGMRFPCDVTIDASGRSSLYYSAIPLILILLSDNVYIVDSNRVRKVTVSTGIITCIAGSSSSGFSGDGEAATSAKLNSPFGVAVDSAGTSFLSYF